MANVQTTSTTQINGNPSSFAFERVAAILQPFDGFSGFGAYGSGGAESNDSGPLNPIFQTGGLVFPFNPAIAEGVQVGYEPMKVIQSNESYYVYQATENQRITLSDCVWVADTFQNARYVIAVLHFFRSFSLMDFGRGRSGKPPSPMWFSAYGNYGFDRIPVLMEKADWSFPSNEECDYVGVPEPGSAEWESGQLKTSPSSSPNEEFGGRSNFSMRTGGQMGTSGTPYTWIPIKFKVNSISLIVQHSPRYWIGFNLDDYRSGRMLQNRGGFHVELPLQSGPLSDPTIVITQPKEQVKPTAPSTPNLQTIPFGDGLMTVP